MTTAFDKWAQTQSIGQTEQSRLICTSRERHAALMAWKACLKEHGMPTEDHGTESMCMQNEDGHKHEPDWPGVSIQLDGDCVYIDIPCKHCGRSGCVGNEKSLSEGVMW